ncbi:hypothetical protein AB0B01_15325 [Streptomyces sp. NPDC044571]|uniref:hypothetical protein n=1 Tax=Streptomyces sp. NPDC044571 TaxID=3155371 RepID=UPI0033EAD11A
MEWDEVLALLEAPGERLPLLSRGEAAALIALLGEVDLTSGSPVSMGLRELQVRIAARVGTPEGH